jgi:predicted RNase H-like HicB family nuclease
VVKGPKPKPIEFFFRLKKMNFYVDFDREDDGRWIACIPELLGVLAYGATQEDARAKVEVIGLRVIRDQIAENMKGCVAAVFG